MTSYFQRLISRAGGAVAPASPLPPALPSKPREVDESDPFELVAGPDPATDRPEHGAPRPVRAEPRMPAPDAAECMETRVEPPVASSRAAPPRMARAPLAARLPDERLVPKERTERVGQPTMRASVSLESPVVAKPVGQLADQDSSGEQESVVPPRPSAMLTPAVTDSAKERMPAPDQREHDAEPEPPSPAKAFETRVIPIGTVERIVERFGERALEPRDGFADKSPPESPPDREERTTPPAVVKLAPPPPSEEPAKARTPDEPRLVIGRLQVDVMPPPAPAPATVRVITRETPGRPRTEGRASNLRFGLGQI